MGSRAVFLDRAKPSDFLTRMTLRRSSLPTSQVLPVAISLRKHWLKSIRKWRSSLSGMVLRRMPYTIAPTTLMTAATAGSLRLFLRAARELDIDLNSSFIVGDMQMDIDTGRSLSCRTFLVTTGPKNDKLTLPIGRLTPSWRRHNG